MPEDREEFGTMKAKYGLKKTWNKAKIIVKSNREAQNYFEAIRKRKSALKGPDILTSKDEGWPGAFALPLRLQQQTVTVDGVHDDEHTATSVGRVGLAKNCAMPKTRIHPMQLSLIFWQLYPSSWRLGVPNGLVTVFRLRQNSRRRNIRLKLTAP
jgi:hypothetical protein